MTKNHDTKNNLKSTTDKFATLNDVVDTWDHSGGLTVMDLGVWCFFFRYEKSGYVTTAQAEIARRFDLDTRTVRKIIRRLIDNGLLTIVEGGKFRKTTRYRLATVKRKQNEKT